MIKAFTELTEDLKIYRINPCLHFIDNEASIALRMKMTSMNIKYQLFTPSNNIANNSERAIKTFKNHSIAGLCRVDKDIHLQLWDRILQQEK